MFQTSLGLPSTPEKLAQNNRIQLVCVPGDMGIDKNKTADQLARQGSSLNLPLAYLQRLLGE
jgi:ribonuclease HI